MVIETPDVRLSPDLEIRRRGSFTRTVRAVLTVLRFSRVGELAGSVRSTACTSSSTRTSTGRFGRVATGSSVPCEQLQPPRRHATQQQLVHHHHLVHHHCQGRW